MGQPPPAWPTQVAHSPADSLSQSEPWWRAWVRQLSETERSRESEEVKLYQGQTDNGPGASEQVRESSQGSSRRNKGGLASSKSTRSLGQGLV